MFWLKLIVATIIILSPWGYAAHKITEANLLATAANAIHEHSIKRMQDAIYMESHLRAVMIGGRFLGSTAPPQHRRQLCRIIQLDGEWPFCETPDIALANGQQDR